MIEYPISILEKKKTKLFDQIDMAIVNDDRFQIQDLKNKIEEINFVIDYLETSRTLKGLNNKL